MEKTKKAVYTVMRFLCSRYFLSLFFMMLEFVQIMIVYSLLYRYFTPFLFLSRIFSICVFLYLINRDEIPEFKLPWMALILLAPAIGAIAFVVLTSNRNSREKMAGYWDARKKLAPYLGRRDALAWLESADPDAAGQARYLCHASGMPCCRDSGTVYYRDGQEFHQALLESLSRAEKFIFMEYFILEPGQMWDPIHQILTEKAAQGVEVYLLYDDIGCMNSLPPKFDKKMKALGIHSRPSNRLTAILSNEHNNRDHRKITVVDGREGFTGGINLGEEYINAVQPYGQWKDTAVRVEGDAVRSLTALFLEAWNSQIKETLDYGIYMEPDIWKGSTGWGSRRPGLSETELPEMDCLSELPSVGPTPAQDSGKGAVIPFGDGPEVLYPEFIGKNVYLNLIHAARKNLLITTPYLICDTELLNALRMAAKRGVDVKIITPHIPDKKIVFLMTRSNYRNLLMDGVKIHEYTPGFIHAKTMVCDSTYAVCGTINLDYRSLVHHYECGVWMYRADCIPDMEADFLETLAVSQEITPGQAALPFPKRLLAEMLKLFAPLF